MGLTGRYNFPGIQKAMGVAIDALIAGTTWGAWLIASPFKGLFNYFRDMAINYLANRGIIFINVGYNIFDGVFDQKKFDNAIDAGIKRVMQGRDKLTPAEGKAIDDEVREAFDEFADVDATTDDGAGVSKFPTTPI